MISDPGYRLVKSVIGRGGAIVPIPGPSAVITSLCASGFPTDRFHFVGFLPAKEGKRKNFLVALNSFFGTIIAFESPIRLLFTLTNLKEIFGDVPVCIAREMTKIHEEFFRGKVSEAIEIFKQRPVKGEVTLIFSS